MSNHTPGPWEVMPYLRPDLDDDPMGVYEVELPVLTQRYFTANPGDEEGDAAIAAVHAENGANARLIAAAPDLLAAADAAESELERMEAATGKPCEESVILTLRAAIAKAKGGA